MATITGLTVYDMLLSGLNNLHNFEHEVNRMNVFPVADGDTGTNMLLTMMGGYQYAKKEAHVGKYLKDFSKGTLLGARGNSGVILSQIFRGIANELINCGIINPREMAKAFIQGYKTAYRAVLKPVEGTLLTVARLGIENIIEDVKGKMTMEEFFSLYLESLLEVLKATPDYLPVLKDAGVFDSGAFGYIKIIEGMHLALKGEIVEPYDDDYLQKLDEAFLDNNNISSTYCVNFLLQLMHSDKYQKDFDLNAFTKDLASFGEICNIFKEGSTIKVRIYTDKLDELLSYTHGYGEFASFNLENNEVQKDRNNKKYPYKKLFIIAVSDSNNMDEKLSSYGVDVFIRGNKNHSPSTKEFLDVLSTVEAEKIAIFPNDINFVETIRQAIIMLKLKNVEIINSYDVLVSYYALMMDIPDDNVSNRIEAFNDNIKNIDYINIYQASRELKNEEFSCKNGDIIATLNNKLIASSPNHIYTLSSALNKIENKEEKVGMIVVINKDDEDLKTQLNVYLEEFYQNIEYEIIEGDNPLVDIKLGVF